MMKFITGIVVGAVLGSSISLGIANVWIYTSDPNSASEEISYEQLFQYSAVAIENGSFICESGIGNTVGAVLAYMMESNSNYFVNKISEDCTSGICQISHSSCAPWQNDSCGSTALIFSIDEEGAIDPDSFKCIQVP